MPANAHADPVVIASAARTPLGRFGGALAPLPATELGALAIRAALDRAGIAPETVDEAIAVRHPCHAQGGNITESRGARLTAD